MPQPESSIRESAIPREFNLVLAGTALLWASASSIVADRAATGITAKLTLYSFQPFLSSIFMVFLVVLGFSLLDWIARRRGAVGEVLWLPLRAGWRREWGIGAAVGWGLALAVVLPALIGGKLAIHFFPAPAMFAQALLTLATLVLATLADELIFRGYSFRRLTEAMGPTAASILLSLIFAMVVVRGNPPGRLLNELAVSMLFGLVLALAYLRTHALWLGWGVHFAYRALTAVILGLPIAGHIEMASVTDTFVRGPLWLSGGQFGFDDAVLTIPLMLVAFAVVYRVTRWYAWEYTHPPIVAGGDEVTVAPPAAHLAMEKQGAAAPPPLVQILPTTSQTPRVNGDSFDPLP